MIKNKKLSGGGSIDKLSNISQRRDDILGDLLDIRTGDKVNVFSDSGSLRFSGIVLEVHKYKVYNWIPKYCIQHIEDGKMTTTWTSHNVKLDIEYRRDKLLRSIL